MVLVPAIALLLAWLSGFWQVSLHDFGFPLAWRVQQCLIFYLPAGRPNVPVVFGCYAFTYDWAFFVLDAEFYAGIGYAMLFAAKGLRKSSLFHSRGPSPSTMCM